LARHILAVAILLSIAVLSVAGQLLNLVQQSSIPGVSEQIPAFLARFNELRKELPARDEIGYINDAAPDATIRQEEYYLTQYALAPAMIVDSPDKALVVANFHQPADQALLKARRLTVVRDFGTGVLLLRRAPQ
jgi:hypothetical protein